MKKILALVLVFVMVLGLFAACGKQQAEETKPGETKPGETKEALTKAIKDNEPVLLNVVIDSEEALPMLPPGAGIDEMIGEYKLEKDVI